MEQVRAFNRNQPIEFTQYAGGSHLGEGLRGELSKGRPSPEQWAICGWRRPDRFRRKLRCRWRALTPSGSGGAKQDGRAQQPGRWVDHSRDTEELLCDHWVCFGSSQEPVYV
jgi:hypothetical protein